MQVAADLLDGKLAPGEALLLLTSSGEAIQPPYGIVEAELALALFAIPADVRSDFRRCGLSASITVVAAESGSSLADVQEWIAVGCPAGPWLLQSALASPVQPEQARPFLAAGAGLPMSLEMSAVGVDPAEFARLAPSAEDSHTLAEELICMRLGMQPD